MTVMATPIFFEIVRSQEPPKSQQSKKNDSNEFEKLLGTAMEKNGRKNETQRSGRGKPEDIKRPDEIKEDETESEKSAEVDGTLNPALLEMLNKLAQILEIPVEKLTEELDKLQLTPMDLLEPEKLELFTNNLAESLSKPLEAVDTDVSNILMEYKEAFAKLGEAEIGKTPEAGKAAPEDVRPELQAEPPAEEGITPEMQAVSQVEHKEATGNEGSKAFSDEKQDESMTKSDFTAEVVNHTFVPEAKVEFEQMVTKTEAIRNVNAEDVISQLSEKIKVDVRGNLTEMRINLKPEHLGDISLKVMTQNGIVSAQLIAENEQVRAIIETNLNELRDMLSGQGLNISQLTVSVNDGNSGFERADYRYQQQRQGRRIGRVSSIAEELPEIPQSGTNEDYGHSEIGVDYRA